MAGVKSESMPPIAQLDGSLTVSSEKVMPQSLPTAVRLAFFFVAGGLVIVSGLYLLVGMNSPHPVSEEFALARPLVQVIEVREDLLRQSRSYQDHSIRVAVLNPDTADLKVTVSFLADYEEIVTEYARSTRHTPELFTQQGDTTVLNDKRRLTSEQGSYVIAVTAAASPL